jgi:transcriptional regulator with XRE-family HTH domain
LSSECEYSVPMKQKSTAAIVAFNVRSMRERAGWSQEAMADAAGLHRTYIGAIERAEKNLTLSTLERVAQVLGVKVVDLLREPRAGQ